MRRFFQQLLCVLFLALPTAACVSTDSDAESVLDKAESQKKLLDKSLLEKRNVSTGRRDNDLLGDQSKMRVSKKRAKRVKRLRLISNIFDGQATWLSCASRP